VAIRATRGVADDDQASFKRAVAEHPNLAIVLARVLDLDYPRQDEMNFEPESLVTLSRVKPNDRCIA